MKEEISWQEALGACLDNKDPEKVHRARVWLAAIGLQGVDSLDPSPYLVKYMLKHVAGRMSFDTLEKRLNRSYKWHQDSKELDDETWEADWVSVHIAELLLNSTLKFHPEALKRIHHYLFTNVYSFAGDFRDYDISKQEWVLNGDTVDYESYETIGESLNQQFAAEAAFSYEGLNRQQMISHLARFISRIWLTHPYGEGNTRSTSVFLLKYLELRGITPYLEVYAGNAWYFRNALVRANFSDPEKNIQEDYSFLEKFLENLIFGAQHQLKNRYLHVDYLTHPEKVKEPLF